MNDQRRGPGQILGRVLTQIVVGLYIFVNSIIGPLFRPFMRWLSSLHVIRRIEAAIGGLPPYAVLLLFAIPVAAEELAKVYAVVLMGSGHFKSGFTVYIGAHVFAILICERIFSAGKDRLLTIPWFAKLFHWLEGYKDRMVAWIKATEAYRWALDVKAKAHQTFIDLKGRTKAVFGR